MPDFWKQLSLIFVSLYNGINSLKKRICSPGSKFFSFRADPSLEGVCCPGKQPGHKKVVPLCKYGTTNSGKIDVFIHPNKHCNL